MVGSWNFPDLFGEFAEISKTIWHTHKEGKVCLYKQRFLHTKIKFTELGTRPFFPGSLFAQFLPMDRYRSIAHFADFQVRSSLNRSKKYQWFALGKER